MNSTEILKVKIEAFKKAQASFSFLAHRGFMLLEERQPVSHDFREGFHIIYSKDNSRVKIQYYEMEFLVNFCFNQLEASNYFIDRNIFNDAVGYAGCMFPPEKLNIAIERIAADIEAHYERILEGDIPLWERIAMMLKASPEKPKLP